MKLPPPHVLHALLALLASFSPVVAQSRPSGRHFDDGKFDVLFDGQTLNGWTTTGGRYDGKAVWTVEEGAITGREGDGHAGGLLYTERSYTNFVFVCDASIPFPFDSGIFLRMVPKPPKGAPDQKGAQVTLDFHPTGEVGAIYADAFLEHNTKGKDKLVRDAWNRLEVRCTSRDRAGHDYRIEFWINGELVTDFRQPEGAPGFSTSGRIGLQVHGGRDDPASSKACFKNIRLLELPEYDAADFAVDDAGLLTPTPAGTANGWKPLFNGKDLAGWKAQGDVAGYAVHDGLLAFPVKGGGGHLMTVDDFTDFELRLDFRIARMCNSGVFLRGDRAGGDPAWSGCEVQILDDFNWETVTKSTLQPWQFCGSLYGSVAPAEKALRPLLAWNSYHITVKGSRIKTELDGKLLYDVDTATVTVPDGHLPFGKRARTGFIGLQRHAGAVAGSEYAWFRNLFVRKL